MSKFLSILALLALASLACNLPLGGPKPPGDPIPVSEHAAEELEHIWESIDPIDLVDGQVEVVITEEQLTSFVALRLADDPETPIQNPQIYLRDGQIQIYGIARTEDFSTPVLVKLTATPDTDGRPVFTITDANFGPLPVPGTLLETISSNLNEALSGQLGVLAPAVEITSVVIADGELTIVGGLRE